jgi:hypothetical protein
MAPAARVQIHLVLPYRIEPREHPRVREYLSRGYRIVQLQRLTDREALVTFAVPPPGPEDPPASSLS